MMDLVTMKNFWVFLPPAILVAFITFFLGRLGTYKDRKLKYRTYLETDEIKATYKLKNHLSNIEDGTRLVIPKEYKDLEEVIKAQIKRGEYDSTNEWNYFKIQPMGESIIPSGSLNLTMRSTEGKNIWHLTCSLPLIGKEEAIYIPTDRLGRMGIEYYIAEIKIMYQTQSGEKLLYKSSRRKNSKGETVITESHSVKKYKLYYSSIHSSKGSNMEWIFLNKDT